MSRKGIVTVGIVSGFVVLVPLVLFVTTYQKLQAVRNARSEESTMCIKAFADYDKVVEIAERCYVTLEECVVNFVPGGKDLVKELNTPEDARDL